MMGRESKLKEVAVAYFKGLSYIFLERSRENGGQYYS
jgi:hypothetical protein